MSTKDSGGTADQLRTDVDQTRADLGGDVTALSDKLNPQARVRRAVGTAGRGVRDYPVPVAAGALALAGATATAVVARRRTVQARKAARRKVAVASWPALAAATALLGRRRAQKTRTARIRAAAGPWFRP